MEGELLQKRIEMKTVSFFRLADESDSVSKKMENEVKLEYQNFYEFYLSNKSTNLILFS